MTVKAAVNATDASAHAAATGWLRSSVLVGTGTKVANPPDASTNVVASRVPSSQDNCTVRSAHANPSPAMRIWSPRCPLAGWSAIAAAGAGGGGISVAATVNVV